MKIGIVIPGVDRIAGAERQAILLARGLARRGWTVTLIALTGSGGEARNELLSSGVRFQSLAMRNGIADPRGWVRFHRWIQKERPDILHAHLPHATWLARGSRLFTPVRVLVDTVHTTAIGGPGRQWAYRVTKRIPDCTTTVGQPVADAYVAANMVDERRVAVVPNGIDEQWTTPDPSARAQARVALGVAHEFLWVAAGRLEPVKDYPLLLRAMTELPRQARLAIAGCGSLEAGLRQMCDVLGLAQRVHFLGYQADVRPLLHAADGFVLCSKWEGLPVSLLEAGACALPCVCTGIPGIREIVKENVTGLLAQPGEPAALSRAMLHLMSMSPEERSAMGLRARAHVFEHFSLSRVLDRWEHLYSNLQERRGQGSGRACLIGNGNRQ